MALTKRLSRVGNSAGVTLDRPILRQVGWEIGTEIEFKVKGDRLILRSARRMIKRHRKSLEKLGE
jgi:antitoxin component of MazEF toxin-antitoxin module